MKFLGLQKGLAIFAYSSESLATAKLHEVIAGLHKNNYVTKTVKQLSYSKLLKVIKIDGYSQSYLRLLGILKAVVTAQGLFLISEYAFIF